MHIRCPDLPHLFIVSFLSSMLPMMKIYITCSLLLTAIHTAAYTVNRDTLFARYLMMNSNLGPLQARGFDSTSPDIHQRGLRLSKVNNAASQRAPVKPTLAPTSKPEKSPQFEGTRPSRSRKIPPDIQNAKQRTLPPSLGQGRITRRPETLLLSKPTSPDTPRRPAGGGTIGHSRIPPKVPKEYPREQRMQIPPSPAEEMRDKLQRSKNRPEKSDQLKTNKSQSTIQKKDSGDPPKDPKIWDPIKEGREEPGTRPPALTSIDDF